MGSGNAFDLDATLKRLDGDQVLFRELIGFFFEDSPAVMERLRAGLRAGNFSSVERAAHSLKGLTANVGSGPACVAAGRIEENARTKDLAAANGRIDDLRQELDRLTSALEQFLATPDPPAP